MPDDPEWPDPDIPQDPGIPGSKAPEELPPADEPPDLSRPTREETAKATELILEDMSRLGLRAVTVSELVAAD